MTLDALLRDVRNGVRRWVRAPLLAGAALASLALGIGATTGLFALVEAVYLKPLPIRDPDRVVRLTTRRQTPIPGTGGSVFSATVWEHVRDAQPVFSGVAAARMERVNLSREGESRFVHVLYASGSFFDVVGVPMHRGRPLLPQDDDAGAPAVAVVDHAFWQRELGGRSDVVGTTLAMEAHAVEIVGITAAGFFGVDVGQRMQVYAPLRHRGVTTLLRATGASPTASEPSDLVVFGRLRPGQSAADAGSALRAWQPALREATRRLGVPTHEHLPDPLDVVPASHATAPVRQRVGQPLLILLAGVVLVLLMICANLAALVGSRLADRRAELWTQRALGASDAQMVRGVVVETLLLSCAGATLGVAVALWLAGIVVPSLGLANARAAQPHLAVSLDLSLVTVAVVLAVVTGLAVGLVPAIRVCRTLRLVPARSAGFASTQRRGSNRGAFRLVVAQVAISLLLVSTTGSLVRSFLKLALQPTVADRDRILLASLSGPVFAATPAATLERLDGLMSHMRAQPGVQSVSVSTITPMSGLIVLSPIEVPGRVNRDPMARAVALNRVTPGFFKVFGIPLLMGRAFDLRDDAHAPPVAIVNRAFERQFLTGEEAIGRRIRLAGREVTIVGVVATAKYMDLRESTRSVAYLPLAQGFRADPQPLRFGIRTESVDRTRGLILAALRRLDPRFLVEFRTLYDEVASSITRERTLAWGGGLIGVLALLLAAIGLYGAFSYMTTRRRGEFAIRLAVGADAAGIRLLVARSAAQVFLVGAALGCAAVFALARLAESLPFGVRAGDVGTLGVSLGVTALVAVVATAGPARAAGRADPARYLRAR